MNARKLLALFAVAIMSISAATSAHAVTEGTPAGGDAQKTGRSAS